ncbi:MAG: YeiH family protein, partial [Eggerthellaceae bacterium]
MIFLEKVKLYIPGILVCAAIALGCTFLGLAFPLIGGPVFGILAGMAIALVWKRRDRTSQGITFTSKKILQYAVILLGFGLNLAEVVRVGAQSLPVIVSTIATALIVAFVLCKALHIPERIATLVGVGSSICGGSAIAATAPVIKARDEEVAQAISVIFLF